jgi:hypothetical protein
MKHALYAILVCCVFLSKAQTPFAYPGAHWCYVKVFPTASVYYETVYPADTVVQGINCTKTEVGFLFVKNDTVFRMLSDGNIYFLYNYNAQPGDIWNIYLEPSDRFNLSDSIVPVNIDSVSTRNIRGDTRRLVFTSVTDTPYSSYGFWLGNVVEGAGTGNWFLPGPWGLVDDGIPFRLCYGDSLAGAFYEQDGSIQLQDSCVCHVWMRADNITDTGQPEVIYDSRANRLRIATMSDTHPVNVQIIDLSGQLVKSVTSYHSNFDIPLEQFSRGIYFCIIRQHNHNVVKKVVVAE